MLQNNGIMIGNVVNIKKKPSRHKRMNLPCGCDAVDWRIYTKSKPSYIFKGHRKVMKLPADFTL